MPAKLEALLLGELIDAPVPVLPHFNQAVRLEVAQVLGDVDLRLLEYRLEMTNAEWGVREQVQDAQPCLVTKALVDFNQLHRDNMPIEEYTSRGNPSKRVGFSVTR